MAQLSKCFLTGDFTDWPVDPATACDLCRVRFVRGQEAVVSKYAELRVRSQVVKYLAHIYIERHVQYLGERSHVLKLHPAASSGNLREQFRTHIVKRVGEIYPPDVLAVVMELVHRRFSVLLTDSSQTAAKKLQHLK